MRQHHRAGEKAFVDYSGTKLEWVERETGEVHPAELFVGVLGASNYTYAEASESQELRCWIGSHVRMFEYFGGVPEAVVPDNLRSGVKSACWYDPELNPTYRDFAEHYDVAVIPTRVKKPQDKAKVEAGVLNAQRWIIARLRNKTFHSVAELNAAIEPLLLELNEREMQGYGKSRQTLFEELDKPALKPLPQHRYCFAEWKQAKVNIDYHIELKRHYYSVPHHLVGKRVEARIGEKTIEVLHEGKRIALHPRDDTPGRHSTLQEHMPAEHRYMQQWTPGRLLDWAEKIGPQTKIQVNSILLSRKHPEQGYRASLGLLGLAKKYGNARLEAACNRANHFGIVSMRSIKNMLCTGNDKLPQERKTATVISHSNIRGDTEFH
jgi:transposase